MQRFRVQTGKDTIRSLAERADPVDAVAELIWNGLDAEAQSVSVDVTEGLLGAVDEVSVGDDGHGMTYAEATSHFAIDGESWKRDRRFSPNTNRPLHGQHGRGRFLAYRLAEEVQWTTVGIGENGPEATEIVGRLASANEFEVDGPAPSAGPTGTVVSLRCRQDVAVNRLLTEGFLDQLRARLAPALRAHTDVSVRFRGDVVDPNDGVLREHEVPITPDPESLAGHDAPRLLVIEWERNTRYRRLLLCDSAGAVVTEAQVENVGTAPFHWTAYLLWDGFRDSSLMGLSDLHVPEVRHRALLDAALAALRQFFAGEVDARRGALVQQWKNEGAYPYTGEARTVTEVMERELFDIVAVVASPGLGRSTKEKKLGLRLLRESVTSDSARTRNILTAVLDLPEHEKEVLEELLERTTLGSIVRAARTVADRLDLTRGLRNLLFADETRRIFREVDQLHPIVAREAWLFGDEWSETLTESGLTRLVKTVLERESPDRIFAPAPVRLQDGRRGRVDLALYRQLPESEASRHLVVELKRSSVELSMAEYGQVVGYASTITKHPEVSALPHRWDFWLVGTSYDSALADLFIDSSRPGLTVDNERYRLWVVTWPELLERAERRLEAFRRDLELVSTNDSAQAYLDRMHAQFIPVVDEASVAES